MMISGGFSCATQWYVFFTGIHLACVYVMSMLMRLSLLLYNCPTSAFRVFLAFCSVLMAGRGLPWIMMISGGFSYYIYSAYGILDWCTAGLLTPGCPVSVVVSAIVHVIPQRYKVFQVFLVFCFVPVDVGGL